MNADAARSIERSGAARPSLELEREIERFLYLEASLLDRREFRRWYELLADDLRYVMPVRTNRNPREAAREFAAPDEGAFFDETKLSIHQRLKRLETGQAWAEMPASRTRHLVTNVLVRRADVDGEYEVDSAFLLYRSRLERQVDLFAGERLDRLRRISRGAGFEIVSRTIHLDQAMLLANNLSVFF